MKRRYWLMVAMAAAAAMLLAGCTSSEKEEQSASAGTTAQAGTGTLAGLGDSGKTEDTQEQNEEAQGEVRKTSQEEGQEEGRNKDQNKDQEKDTQEPTQTVSGTEVKEAGTASGDLKKTVPNQTADGDAEDVPETEETDDWVVQIDDAETESETEVQQETEEDLWSGTYVSDEETLTLRLEEDALAFAFAQSGISGTADVTDIQAVYRGDDHYVIVFNLDHTVVEVSVSNEEDYDASDSPLIGTYIRSEEAAVS